MYLRFQIYVVMNIYIYVYITVCVLQVWRVWTTTPSWWLLQASWFGSWWMETDRGKTASLLCVSVSVIFTHDAPEPVWTCSRSLMDRCLVLMCWLRSVSSWSLVS